ncbi:MAG: hypothetical protein ABSD78_15965 [Acidimicrobiales bacterium]
MKSKSSYAALPLSPELEAVLADHEKWQQTQLGATGTTNATL